MVSRFTKIASLTLIVIILSQTLPADFSKTLQRTQDTKNGSQVYADNLSSLTTNELIEKMQVDLNTIENLGSVLNESAVVDITGEETTNLQNQVASLATSGDVPKDTADQLKDVPQKIDEVRKIILSINDKSDNKDTEKKIGNILNDIDNKLNAFINYVQAQKNKKISNQIADQLTNEANTIITGSMKRGQDVIPLLSSHPSLPLTQSVFDLINNEISDLRGVIAELQNRGVTVEATIHHSILGGAIRLLTPVGEIVLNIGAITCGSSTTLALELIAAKSGTFFDTSQKLTLFLINTALCNLLPVLDQHGSDVVNFYISMVKFVINQGSAEGVGKSLVQPSVQQQWISIAQLDPTGFSENLINELIGIIQPAVLVVTKRVINDEGGTKNAGDFTIHVKGTRVSLPSFPGSASGTTVTMAPGAFSVSEDPSSQYATTFLGICSNNNIKSGETDFCTVTNTFTPTTAPPVFFENFDDGSLTSTGWSPVSCPSGLVCVGQSTLSQLGFPAISPPFWGFVRNFAFGSFFCPPSSVSTSKSFTVAQAGNYDVSAWIAPSICDGCIIHNQLFVDSNLLFDHGVGFVSPGPPPVFDKTVIPLSAGTHTVTMQMFATAECNGAFPTYMDNISIQQTSSPATPPPVGGPYFKLQVNQTSFNATSPSTIVVPLKVIWNMGHSAEPVSTRFMGNTTSVVPSITSVANTTSSQLFNVILNVPSGVQARNYYVGIQISEPDGDSQFVPIFVKVQ